ncbi:hypothetical protein A2803_04705 [Candidatus Woesebacteria bacterium RIFCSPHIGHO2_01_FULL_44_21]|uniref:PABS domain-containing protein n=1 Tax=Candidatus Woesebacteria bacterium RIFCSPHIGHO2_01_FULL_44_21 TaxID=1802503 RepID=A0A1F7Z1S9_9BACT|nr:MAG: hypothetical protein A2803_04705 [Candidatus Woesebacteria bacterium RIFCSPHIGHO2_01_FULL_44_21]OGM69418.1 MAG: hypothetical protein A2897_03635 [Candidatus Woesebacteria bacterium RIFCSPLOWO2_01_FULL_44_24b]
MSLTNLLEGRVVLKTVNSDINGELTVIRDLTYGTYIRGGGLPQSGGLAEVIWKSTLNRVKEWKSERVKGCLIVGLGGGSIAKLVRKNWPEVDTTGVDIDPVIVGLGKKYMKLDKQNVNIVIADAEDAMKDPIYNIRNTTYDLICFDTYVGAGFPKKFESVTLIKQVKDILSPDGIAIFNRLYGPRERDNAIKFEKVLQKVFNRVDRLYPEANIMFVCTN